MKSDLEFAKESIEILKKNYDSMSLILVERNLIILKLKEELRMEKLKNKS
jgi:hypothetical protein